MRIITEAIAFQTIASIIVKCGLESTGPLRSSYHHQNSRKLKTVLAPPKTPSKNEILLFFWTKSRIRVLKSFFFYRAASKHSVSTKYNANNPCVDKCHGWHFSCQNRVGSLYTTTPIDPPIPPNTTTAMRCLWFFTRIWIKTYNWQKKASETKNSSKIQIRGISISDNFFNCNDATNRRRGDDYDCWL